MIVILILAVIVVVVDGLVPSSSSSSSSLSSSSLSMKPKRYVDTFNEKLLTVVKTSLVSSLLLPTASTARMESILGNYKDVQNGYEVDILPGWTSIKKSTPTPSLEKFQEEEVLFTSTNFVEGSSLSITRTNAARLLKDFDIEWWFSPLTTMKDVGSADLIAKLLILQRQGEFEKKQTTSEILNAKITDTNELTFDFDTPLASSVLRRTIVKSYLRNNILVTVWLSALVSVFDEGGYGSSLNEIRSSFKLL